MRAARTAEAPVITTGIPNAASAVKLVWTTNLRSANDRNLHQRASGYERNYESTKGGYMSNTIQIDVNYGSYGFAYHSSHVPQIGSKFCYSAQGFLLRGKVTEVVYGVKYIDDDTDETTAAIDIEVEELFDDQTRLV
jgi:hypothetical protein